MTLRKGLAKTSICFGAIAVAVVPISSSLAAPAAAGAPVGFVDEASYTVSPQTGRPRTDFVATLRNEGLSTIEYGNPFAIAVRRDGQWQRLRHGRRCAWTMEARILRPGDSATQEVGWLGRKCRYRRLDPGLYRVSKSIRFTEGGSSETREDVIRARFRVTNN